LANKMKMKLDKNPVKKNPKMVAAGKKAALTRAKNMKKSGHGKVSKPKIKKPQIPKTHKVNAQNKTASKKAQKPGVVIHAKGHKKAPFGGKVVSIEKLVNALQTFSKKRKTKTMTVPEILKVTWGKVKGIDASVVEA